MAARREILDSEDEGSDFGDGPELADAETHETVVTREEEPHETAGASHNAGTDSTDPIVPDTAPTGAATSTWTDISPAPPPGQKTKECSSLTSITDPVPASRKSKRIREVDQTEAIDLTSIITPRKEAPSMTSDIVTRTYGKRKAVQLSLEQESMQSTCLDTRGLYAFPTPRRRQRGTGAGHLPAQLSSAAREALSSGRRTRSSRKKKFSFDVRSILPDTAPPSLYIARRALTASQKQEYQLASEGLLTGQSLGVGEMYRSSAATTIAYPTPSRITPPPPLLPAVSEEGVPRTSLGHGDDYQQSSPDVLADMTSFATPSSRRSKTKVVSSAGLDSSELSLPTSARRAKKRKVVRLGSPVGQLGENLGDKGSIPMVELIDVEVIELTQAEEAIEPPPKRRHGRPRKSEASRPLEPEHKPEEQPRKEEPEPEPEPKAEPEAEPEPDTAPQRLAELNHNSQPNATVVSNGATYTVNEDDEKENDVVAEKRGAEKDKAADKEKQAAKDVKVGAGVQKVRYRVGLSNRTRIAPLLKCLRKPT
ncbi:hypothetical protein C7999DRAFT_37459 [Corynascus novoguineensis]|uniref:Uncharacterized protein n=1 Tax=Corynascus novoguineensis TaxID=1126955 RepID=A0AAN7D0W1_9PEZI|nr:hypothetical protein C7999DRAFT_37459 [Corynascus novoguineensis]